MLFVSRISVRFYEVHEHQLDVIVFTVTIKQFNGAPSGSYNSNKDVYSSPWWGRYSKRKRPGVWPPDTWHTAPSEWRLGPCNRSQVLSSPWRWTCRDTTPARLWNYVDSLSASPFRPRLTQSHMETCLTPLSLSGPAKNRYFRLCPFCWFRSQNDVRSSHKMSTLHPNQWHTI